jgi:hypothetical protein
VVNMTPLQTSTPKHVRQTRIQLGILLGILLLRLLFTLPLYEDPHRTYYADSRHYIAIAERFLEGQAYRWRAVEKTELLRTIGYPLMVAITFWTLGVSFANVALVQLVIGGLICLMIYDLVRRFASQKAGFIAGLIYALDPASTLWATAVLSETLFAFFVTLTVFALGRWYKSDRYKWLILAGISAGFAPLVRPIGQLLLPFSAFFILIRRFRLRPFRFEFRRVYQTTLFVFLAALILVPYALRNYFLWDQFTISSTGTYTLGRYFAASVMAEVQGITREEAARQLGPKDTANKPGDRERYMAIIMDEPIIALKNHLKGDIPVLFGNEYADWFRRFGVDIETPGAIASIRKGEPAEAFRALSGFILENPLVGFVIVITVAYQLFIYITALFGAVRHIRNPALLWLIMILGITAAIILLTPGVVGEARFRVPAQPSLVCLSGLAFLKRG